MKEEDKDLNYWKKNAEECYMTTPIGVLRYITELEKVVKNSIVSPVVRERVFGYPLWLSWIGMVGLGYMLTDLIRSVFF